ALYGLAARIGVILSVTRPNGWIVLVLGAVGGLIGIFYTLPPLALQYHGIGEVAVTIIFGPIVVLGAYAVQRGALGWEAFLASLPLGLLVGSVVLVNVMPRVASDAK